MSVKQPAKWQNGQHLSREKGISHRHTELTAAHPIVIILRVRANLVCQLGIRGFALVKGFYNLNAVYVLNHSAAHFGSCFNRALVVLCVVAHNRHHKNKRNGEYRK